MDDVTTTEEKSGRSRKRSEIARMLDEYERVRRRSLGLVASENLMSPAALRACMSDAAHRYTLPPPEVRSVDIWDYPNQLQLNRIEHRVQEMAMELFGAHYVDVRPLSGNNAVFCVLAALAQRGDRVLRVPDDCGGHFATAPIAALLGVELVDIPYDRERGEVDVEGLCRAYRKTRPALVLFDASMMVFTLPLREIRGALGREAVISYDVSHPMGIIGGGGFQNPLTGGADLMHGSTHKSLFGPQKGMILCREAGDIAERISRMTMPTFVSNIHSHHVAALGVALEEMLSFGKEYAKQVVANARTLARALEGNGLTVFGRERGYTDCHQIWVILGSRAEAVSVSLRLEDVGIFVNAIRVPFTEHFGLRIGLSELTRRGMQESEMDVIADLVARCVAEKSSTASLRAAVEDLSRRFDKLSFAFSS